MAIALQPLETNVRRIVEAIRQIIQGRSNATLQATLTPATTTTTVTAVNCGNASEVFLSPRTANAAAALATTYVSAVNQGSFVLTHASNAQTDRTYGIVVLGG